eukprot:scaffold28967_cov118-Isochrysis_galbana.AAC.2
MIYDGSFVRRLVVMWSWRRGTIVAQIISLHVLAPAEGSKRAGASCGCCGCERLAPAPSIAGAVARESRSSQSLVRVLSPAARPKKA